VNLYAHAHAPT